MPTGTVDISWGTLQQIVRGWAGTSAELAEFMPLEGGSFSTTLCLTCKDGKKAVLKITPHRVDRRYADEALQLHVLKEAGMPVPEVYAFHVGTLDSPFSYVLMEFVAGVNLHGAKSTCSAEEYDAIQSHLAEMLCKLHSNTGPYFMRVTGTDARRHRDWPGFYHDLFDPIWSEVEKEGHLPPKCRRIVAKVHNRLDRLLAHDDVPRLVHWDVWATNLLARCDDGGKWQVCALLDPNCKFAHAEAEIAYLELFQTVTPTFLKAYQHWHKLPPEYHRVRKPIYQLYSLLNHLRLFGHEYLKRAVAQIEKVAPLV